MGGKGVPGRTGSSRKPGSSQIFRHPDTGSHIRTTARTWTAGLAAWLGPGGHRAGSSPQWSAGKQSRSLQSWCGPF